MTRGATSSAKRMFAAFAVTSALPIIVLGLLLAHMTARQVNERGLAQAQAEASLLAKTVVAPLLNEPGPMSVLSAEQTRELQRNVASAIRSDQVVRLRLRDLSGKVVFADDGDLDVDIDDEAVEAAHGRVETDLTTLGSDDGDRGGPRVLEAYEPVYAAGSARVVGVVELYLPYAPIERQLVHEQHELEVAVSAGLLGLWIVLLGLAVWTSRKLRKSSEDNAYLALHDALTGLPNRADFVATVASVASAGAGVIALIDLDRFKQVNDTLGHVIGDRLLVELSARLSEHLREGDVVARLGGDEFGILLRDVQDEREAVLALDRLKGLISEQLVIDDLPLAVEASIGFVIAPLDGTDVDVLVTKADVAMYAAKRGHLGPTRHLASHEQYDAASLRLVGELGEAIEQGQLVLHYQPKTDLIAGRISSVEALVRWQHPERGLLYPDAFLIAAEQTDLVDPLTRWVLAEALRALPRLDPTGCLAMAVNVSARSLGRLDFADEILETLVRERISPDRLLVEMTETALLVDPDRAAATLTRLASAGVRISIDDFGAGQTSLGYLATLPIHELKIDRAFVMAMDREPRNAAIVRSVIDLAHNLGFSVTAEGVETGEVLASLTSAHCDCVQGYYLARPADEAATGAFLQLPVRVRAPRLTT